MPVTNAVKMKIIFTTVQIDCTGKLEHCNNTSNRFTMVNRFDHT